MCNTNTDGKNELVLWQTKTVTYMHGVQGWEAFTDAAIAALSARRQGVVFLLWGNFAITKGGRVDKAKHHVLTAAHPSPLAASRVGGCQSLNGSSD
jgi:uracil-DNA glycosylase